MKSTGPCLKIFSNFRSNGRQITHEPWHSDMSRIQHNTPRENWPTCQSQLISFRISYSQLQFLCQFVPIPNGQLWIPKILPGSLFHNKFFPTLGLSHSCFLPECPFQLPDFSAFRSQLKASPTTLHQVGCSLVSPSLTLVSFRTFITACIYLFVWFLIWFGLVLSSWSLCKKQNSLRAGTTSVLFITVSPARSRAPGT